MSRNGSGVYSLPGTYLAVTGETIQAQQHNDPLQDLESDANAARPIVAGGTGAATEQAAIDNFFAAARTIKDDKLTVVDPSDTTKKIRLDAGAVTAGQTRVLSAPDRDIEIASVPRGHIYGLTLSNNGTDATNDIDIAAGEAASSDTSPYLMVLGASITKKLDAAWAVGTNAGGLDTGAIANGTYHVFLIQRSDTGVVDVLFSASASSPTMPTNYDRKRRIGSIVRASAAILAFTQYGDRFEWVTPPKDANGIATTSTAGSMTLTVPTGLNVEALLSGEHFSSAAAVSALSVFNPAQTVSSGLVQWLFAQSTTAAASGHTRVVTNTSAQVKLITGLQGGTSTVWTIGWVDRRGRDS